MKLWKRKNEIVFFHNEPSIIDNFPIIESKNLKLQWVNKVKQDFENLVKEGAKKDISFNHLSKCPGIFDLFKYGYVIPLHKDIQIRPRGMGFESTAVELTSFPNHFQVDTPSERSVNLISKPPWAEEFIIKIDTGWHIIAPKGVKFIMLPIAYPDTFDFTATIGIINPALSTAINFQMFWNGTEDTVITAGTPLGHLIPLSEKKFKMVQRIMNQRDLYWVNMLQSAYNTSFWRHTMRKKVSDMYNKYWKG